jgi:hypothetical protein
MNVVKHYCLLNAMGKQDRGRDVCKNGESGGGKMR